MNESIGSSFGSYRVDVMAVITTRKRLHSYFVSYQCAIYKSSLPCLLEHPYHPFNPVPAQKNASLKYKTSTDADITRLSPAQQPQPHAP